jgi:drug/metabolite transporter (DMT)-like permease
LLAAVTFGASAPFAKRLVGHGDPELLAGLLYLGAAVVLALAGSSRRRGEPGLRRSDVPTMTAVVVAGGVVAPVLLLVGLQRVSGVTGSLVLNVEAPLTMLFAVFVFGEHLSLRAWIASALIVAGGAVLALGPGAASGAVLGVILVGAACACWALDNNLTQRLTVRDPVVIVRIKATGAAATNLAIAAVRGPGWPPWWVIGGALALGAVSYGASIVLDVYALRMLGAAREAALFATAPFAGVMIALAVFDEPLGFDAGLALIVMAVGTALLVTDRHEHRHRHGALAHEHRHVHDAHHEHEHSVDGAAAEPHSHWHLHTPMVHAHPHVSDLHHRHTHGSRDADGSV